MATGQSSSSPTGTPSTHRIFSSTSSSNGNLQVTATFEPGTNVDQAIFEVNNRVQRALPRLPDEVRRNGVLVQKRSFDILLVVSMISPGNQRDTLFLSNYASLNIVDELKRLPDVERMIFRLHPAHVEEVPPRFQSEPLERIACGDPAGFGPVRNERGVLSVTFHIIPLDRFGIGHFCCADDSRHAQVAVA